MAVRVCRWGILSTATIGRKNWLAIVNSGNATVAAVASRSKQSAAQFIHYCGARWPIKPEPRALGSYAELIDDPNIDAVYVPLPTGMRKEWVIKAAEAGKHVLCEKPCAIHAADLREMTAACAKNKVQFMDGVMYMHSQRLEALRAVAIQADVVLLHANALDLRRMFVGRTPRPVLLAGNRPDSLTHAYTSMKLLSQRLGALGYDLVIAGDVAPRRARKMADRLTECADHFLGAALRQVAVLDPQVPPHTPLPLDLLRLAASHVELTSVRKAVPAPPGVAPRPGVAAGRLN